MKRFCFLVLALITSSGLHPASVPQLKAIQALSLLNPAQKTALMKSWNTLYQLQQQTSTPSSTPVTITPAQHTQLQTLFGLNYFQLIATWCQSPTLLNTLKNPLQQNYCLHHLAVAAERLASVCSIDFALNKPEIRFTGDIRDFGIIVNIHNHTGTTFTLYQNDATNSEQTTLAEIVPGLNEVNLHTAALQETAFPAPDARTVAPSSSKMFHLQSTNSQIPSNIFLRMYTGKELKNFLHTLPRKNPKIFSMNGLPTSEEFLANDASWYLVLIQNPSSSTQPEANFDQRIQAINLSTLSGPYLLEMQINQDSIEIISNGTKQIVDFFQPSLTNAFVPNSQHTSLENMPFLILNSTLWQNNTLKTLWTMAYTCSLATLTDYKLFGPSSFGNAYKYLYELGFFNPATAFSFFIDRYNTTTQLGYIVHNAPWLVSCGIYETNLASSTDIPQIFISQDELGNLIVNAQQYYYVSFLTTFEPQNTQIASEKLFDTKGLSSIYALPQYQLYSTITNALQKDITQGIFGILTKINNTMYKIVYKNKTDQIISSQIISLDSPISNIQISFVNQGTDWVGSALPMNLVPTINNQTTHFKVTYEDNTTNNRHILLTQATSAIDQQDTILPFYFAEFPIQELYIDLFEKFNITPFTRCHIIQNSIMPSVLSGLIEQDWKNGIYMIPSVHNNSKITPLNPGELILTFYRYDKTIIGQYSIQGINSNNGMAGIQHPVTSYSPHFSESTYLADLYLNTGVLLRYNS